MHRMVKWLAIVLVFALLAGCGDASNYIKENYSLIDVQGQGKDTSKIYSVFGKDVPTVAKELAENEPPSEISKEAEDQMFLVYDNKIINVQKDPESENSTLVQLDSIEYAKDHYDSSFLQGYVTATLLQSLFGGGWSGGGGNYRGYTSTKRYEDYGKHQSAPAPSHTATPVPSSTERKGTFTTSPSSSSASKSSGQSIRRNDGSTKNYKAPRSIGSKPSTSKRSGSFKRR
ncbi:MULTISPECIES: DUF4247 domain-containing protein [unclassified Paenibacillus]|uniref:DUF4247 domain-containing protein n=1 Tax=unclassified Paenibacillus TaxID=185978 RepID=UPI001AE2C94F|nr:MULTISPECIES: DUF4247 domain-containing protein [unclassified Paenibacillus]MBP1154763.1 hypothetical protein [Paenibacillus sp. PvP091]MBP1169853.1 hypothetical protein [Paenibacillus sp. PvR098]MBP2440881.1 hypothetical protein [Paenibacillus sp. PvP052]